MDWLSNHQWEAWLAAALLLGAAEMFSLDLILAMLAVGALGGMVTSLVTSALAAQVIVAVLVSLAMLAVVRPSLVRRLHSGPELVLGHRTLIGKQATVTHEIAAHSPGRILVEGESWQARAYDDATVIPEGGRVDILQIKGATAYVVPANEELPRLSGSNTLK